MTEWFTVIQLQNVCLQSDICFGAWTVQIVTFTILIFLSS